MNGTPWSVLLLVVGWVYTVERCGPSLRAGWDRWMAHREQAQQDQRSKLDGEREDKARVLRDATKGRVIIPPDLDAVILSESAKFAQDELRADILDRYALYGDWNKVRTAVGVGHIDEKASA